MLWTGLLVTGIVALLIAVLPKVGLCGVLRAYSILVLRFEIP